ncbi:MAG: hypothetical protein FJ403_01395 [Verrucomicrobia bacterium]|nr:hypothetical protein [Verrucomicrobiota bacterium]
MMKCFIHRLRLPSKGKSHRRILLFTLSALTLSLGCRGQFPEAQSQPTEVLARLHFGGFDQLGATTNAATLWDVWKLPVTAELRDQALDKLSVRLAQSFSHDTNAPAAMPNVPALIRPMLDDLLRSESFFELRGRSIQPFEWALAVHLDKEREPLWRTNWSQLSSLWNPKSTALTNRVSFTALNAWFLLGSLPESEHGFPTNAAIYQQIRTHSRPISLAQDYWLKAEINLPRLLGRAPFDPSLPLPSLDLTLKGRGPTVRAQGRLTFSETMSWSLEKWRIPTNTISDPANSLIAFSAIQGFGPWLSRHKLTAELGLKSPPNQAYFWAHDPSRLPNQILAALPVPNVTNTLQNFISEWVPRLNTNLLEDGYGRIEYVTNELQVSWGWLPPVIRPYIRPAPEPGGDHLEAGVFPLVTMTNTPPPAALLDQLSSRTNLLFYDWEITQHRLEQFSNLMPFLSLFLTVPERDATSISSRWLAAVAPKLGNTITEIAATSPKELSLVRNSHIGFTGAELMTLAYWLDSTNFPAANFRLGFKPIPRSTKPAPPAP